MPSFSETIVEPMPGVDSRGRVTVGVFGIAVYVAVKAGGEACVGFAGWLVVGVNCAANLAGAVAVRWLSPFPLIPLPMTKATIIIPRTASTITQSSQAGRDFFHASVMGGAAGRVVGGWAGA